MVPLNYCRQALFEFKRFRKEGNINSIFMSNVTYSIDLLSHATKFILPENGILIEDNNLRALDPDMPISLPYPVIALEFQCKPVLETCFYGKDYLKLGAIDRVIILAADCTDGNVYIQPLFWKEKNKFWFPHGFMSVPVENYLTRNEKGEPQVDSKLQFFEIENYDRDYFTGFASSCLFTFFSFLNALQCSNVGIERVAPKRTLIGHSKKDTSPFDEYHILSVKLSASGDGKNMNGHHASPREHLRRGHIRRLQSGRKVWVNAAIVNAGVGGKVSKDYSIR